MPDPAPRAAESAEEFVERVLADLLAAEAIAFFESGVTTEGHPVAARKSFAAAIRARDAAKQAEALENAAEAYASIIVCDCAGGRDEHELGCPQETSDWLRTRAAAFRGEGGAGA